ncbi:MAG: helix-turn-helix domain-containing protein [Spirochaetaceae bacterium]|nr:helix-turn-helix domain-containing protein [Spirochaetaceae bacterium]
MSRNVGLLLGSIHMGVAENVWSSFVREAERRGWTLLVFLGGTNNVEADLKYLRGRIFTLAMSLKLDGLIGWSSSFGNVVSIEEYSGFPHGLDVLPFVSISHKVSSYPCVLFDAYSGMKDLVTHFIQVHKAGNIAFLRGPKDHQSAQDRFNGYWDALIEANLPVNETLVSPAFDWADGEAACAFLVEKRSLVPGRDFDTLVGSSDMMIFPAIEYLEKRGYKMAVDYRAGGFNDSFESKLLPKQLSTVRLPYAELAEKSFSLLETLCDGKPLPDGTSDAVLPCTVIVRESCGCPYRPELSLEEARLTEHTHLLARYRMQTLQNVLNSLKSELLGVRDRCALVESLARHLPKIGIDNAALVLDNDDRSESVWTFSETGIYAGKTIPHSFFSGSFMAVPLFTGKRPAGFFMHNVPFYDSIILEELRSAVSRAFEDTVPQQPLEKPEPERNRRIVAAAFDADMPLVSLTSEGFTTTLCTKEELSEQAAAFLPAAVILGTLDTEAIADFRRRDAMTPLVILPPKITGIKAVEQVCLFPRVILCHRAAARSPAFIKRLRSIADGSEILPVLTGKPVKKALLFIDKMCTSQISRWQLAESVHVSEDYLTRIFRRELGLSPWEYINHLRVSIAAEMLLHTGKPIYTIALDTGFKEHAYFNRVFKKVYGKPPNQLRKSESAQG